MTTFAPLFLPSALREAVSDDSWLRALLAVEAALARAEERAGVIPAAVAEAIAAACNPASYDVAALCAEGRTVGNPVEPLVRAVRGRVGGEAARYVHFGATSQDVLDTASMLVARDATRLVALELDGACTASAALAEAQRSTPMAGRTLLQQAVPTTFGLKAAGWLDSFVAARARVRALEPQVELGGAAGTLAALGGRGVDVVRELASELELTEPSLPWHARRGPVADVGAALAAAATAAEKVGLDVVLLAQTELGEVTEAAGGASSTMPHKQNPVRAVLARACAQRALAECALLQGGGHELERAAGAWHVEWGALSGALAFAGAAVASARECLEGLVVHPDRMRANMRDADLLSERRALGDDDPDPTTYLGSAQAFVDRALAAYRTAP